MASWASELWPATAIGIAARATLLLLLAIFASCLFRRSSAALRHRVWTLAVVGVLVMPLASLLLPPLEVVLPDRAVWPTDASLREGGSDAVSHIGAPIVDRRQESTPTAGAAAESIIYGATLERGGLKVTSAGVSRIATERLPNRHLLRLDGRARPADTPRAIANGLVGLAGFIWLVGALVMLLRLVASVHAGRLLARKAEVCGDGNIAGRVAQLAADLGIRRRIVVLRGAVDTMPMTWGVARPAVLLPAGASDWPAGRLRRVLLHELAHVRRHDHLIQLVAEFTRSIYWFHPLVWLALSRLRLERELACDDLVLQAGARPSAYATDLVEVARAVGTRPPAAAVGIAMARSAQLHDRLEALLAERRDRRVVSPSVRFVSAFLAIGVVTGLAAMRPVGASAVEAGHAFDNVGSEPGASGHHAIDPEATTGMDAAIRDRLRAGVALAADDAYPAQTVDVGGTRIVESDSPAIPAGSWTLSEEPQLEIGLIERDEPYSFQNIAHAQTLPDGRIVVVDNRASSIRLFSAEGVHLASLGGRGQGPGEFQNAFVIRRLPGDTIVLLEPGRYSFFTGEGEFVRRRNSRGLAAPSYPLTGDRSLWILQPSSSALTAGHNRLVHYAALGIAGEPPTDTIAILPGGEMFRASNRSGSSFIPIPFAPAAVHVFDHSSQKLVTSGDGHELLLHALDGGPTTRWKVARDPRPVTSEVWDRTVSAEIGIDRGSIPSGLRAAWETSRQAALAQVAAPFHMPAFDQLRIDLVGRVWARTFMPPGEAAETSEWWIFDHDGVWLTSMEIPAKLELMEVADGHVLGRWADELGIQSLRRYPILKPE